MPSLLTGLDTSGMSPNMESLRLTDPKKTVEAKGVSSTTAFAFADIGSGLINSFSAYKIGNAQLKHEAVINKIRAERKAVQYDLQLYQLNEEAALLRANNVRKVIDANVLKLQAESQARLSQAVNGQIGRTADHVLERVRIESDRGIESAGMQMDETNRQINQTRSRIKLAIGGDLNATPRERISSGLAIGEAATSAALKVQNIIKGG